MKTVEYMNATLCDLCEFEAVATLSLGGKGLRVCDYHLEKMLERRVEIVLRSCRD